MGGALIILAVTVAVGVLLWAWEKARGDRPLHHHSPRDIPADSANSGSHEASPGPGFHEGISGPDSPDDAPGPNSPEPPGHRKISSKPEPPTICCGLHAICEKTGQVNDPPEYYDDEELDRYAGRNPDGYANEEIEEFRDVLLTLAPSDAPGWAVSLQKRRISLPTELQPELELLLAET